MRGIIVHNVGADSGEIMQLSTRVRYACRALTDLAAHYGEGTILLRDIAERQGLSQSYLENLMVSLKAAGLVRTRRGRQGGYTLSRPPEEIKLGHIFTALEGPLTLIDCVSDPRLCPHSDTCVTRDVWREMEQAMTTILEMRTLGEMVRQTKKKEHLRTGGPGGLC